MNPREVSVISRTSADFVVSMVAGNSVVSGELPELVLIFAKSVAFTKSTTLLLSFGSSVEDCFIFR